MPPDAEHEDYLVDPLSNLTAPVHTEIYQTQEASAAGVGSEHMVELLCERPTILPKIRAHGLQAYTKPLNSYQRAE